MRMLNYSRETNPFLRGAHEFNKSTKQNRTPNNIHDEQFKHQIGHDRNKSYDHSRPHEKSLTKRKEYQKPLENIPPSTVFATLEDMNFTDASTISDDVCSILTNHSSDSILKQTHVSKRSKVVKPNIDSTQRRVSTQRGVDRRFRNHELKKITTNTDVMTKSKTNGMTLKDALSRQRNIIDGNSIIIEHCQSPHSVEMEQMPTTRMEDSNKTVIKCNIQSKPHDFMDIRSKLKKVRRVKPILKQSKDNFFVHVDQSISRAQISTPLEKLSPVDISSPNDEETNCTEYRDEKPSHKSSDATTTTLSIFSSESRSSVSLETPTHSKGFKSQNSPNIVSRSNMKRGIIDDRNDAEHSQRSDDNNRQIISEDENPNMLHNDRTSNKNEKLKVDVPGAVVNVVKRDRTDQSIIDSKNEMTLKKQSEKEDVAPPLKEDPEFIKYFKMQKMGLPLGAVKNALQRDGKDPSIMDLDPEKSLKSQMKDKSLYRNGSPSLELYNSDSSGITSEIESKKQKEHFRRTRLHWNILKNLSEKSIWSAIKKDTDIANLQIDELEFKTLFQYEITKPRRTLVKDSDTENAVKVIDRKRANNGGITLARLKMSYDDIALAIKSMDVSNLNAQQLSGIIEFLPTEKEKKALKSYIKKENDKLLCECEKFMVSFLGVSDAHKKTHTMLFMLQFPAAISEISSEVNIKIKACAEIVSSVRFRKILGIILKVGNRLNNAGEEIESDSTTDANGFSVESLSKLNQVKACDKKTSVLEYIGTLIQRSNRSLLQIKDDFPHVFKAQSISSDHDKSLASLEKQLVSARAILESYDQSPFVDYGNDDNHNHEDGNNNNSSSSSSSSNNNNDNSCFHLHKFILEASQSLSVVREANEQAKAKFISVLEYFSIENDVSPNTLFGIVASFCKEMNSINESLSKSKKSKHSLHIGEEANRGVSLGSSLRNKAKGGMRNYGGTYVPVRE